MKTRKLLFAMALPAVFAACTAEDLVETSSVKTLDGRAVLGSVPMDIVQGDAETKFVWEASKYAWKFETGDQYGAAITDPTLGTVADKMLTNYIYTQQANGSYDTNSQMVEGSYFFYSYPGFADRISRNLISFELGAQTADLDNPEAVMQENQLFISPVYKVRDKTRIPLAFRPFWSAAVVKIVNNTNAAFKLSQIVLKDDAAKFDTKGEISPVMVDAAVRYVIPEGGSSYTIEQRNTTVDKLIDPATQLTVDLVAESSMIALNCADYEVAKGAEVTAYMTVPAGTQSNLSAEIIVNVNGMSKKIVVKETTDILSTDTKSIPVTGLKNVKFTRGKTNSVFGVTNTGAVKPLNIAQANLQDADGFYVNTNADLLNVLNSQTGAIQIYNIGNVKIDNSIASALASYSGADVTFANAIDIETTSAASIAKAIFNGGVNLKGGTVTFGNKVELAAGTALTITSGKAILSNGTYDNTNSKIVVNGGELVVNAALPIKAIDVQKGTLTLQNANQTIGATTAIETLTFGTDNATALNVSLGSENNVPHTLTIKSLTLAEKTVATINSPVDVTGALTNKGKIVNKANITTTGTASITNNGTIETAATVEKLTNNSNGYVKLTDGWYSKVVMNGGSAGLVDNTVGGVVEKNSSNCTVYRVLTGSNPAIKKVEDLMVLNNVTFTRDATIQNALFLGATSIEGGTVTVSKSLTIGKADDKATAVIKRVLGLTGNALDNYKVSVRVYEGATLNAASAAYKVGTKAELLNRGHVYLPSSADVNAWSPIKGNE